MRSVALLVGLVGCELPPGGDGKGAEGTGDTGAPAPVDADGDGALSDVDCDDAAPRVHPGAEAWCGAEDADCDGVPEPRVRVPGDEPDLGAAVAAGGLVCLEPGTYAGFSLAGGSVRVGAVSPGSATLAGSGQATLTLGEGADVVLEDLVLGGDCACEGAALVADGATLRLRDAAVRGVRQADGDHGPLFVRDGTLALERVTVDDVEVTAGLGGLVALDGGAATFTDVTVTGLRATHASNLQGGLVWANDGAVTLERVSVWDTALAGSAVYGGLVYAFDGTVVLDEVAVAGTRATTPGAVRGLVVDAAFDGGTVSITDSTFVDLAATADTCVGLAVNLTGPALTATNATFQDLACATAETLVDAGSGGAAFRYCSFSGNDGGWDGLADPVGADGNVADAGTYAGPRDLAPAAGSPLVDAGDPALTDADGSRSDIGVAGSTR